MPAGTLTPSRTPWASPFTSCATVKATFSRYNSRRMTAKLSPRLPHRPAFTKLRTSTESELGRIAATGLAGYAVSLEGSGFDREGALRGALLVSGSRCIRLNRGYLADHLYRRHTCETAAGCRSDNEAAEPTREGGFYEIHGDLEHSTR